MRPIFTVKPAVTTGTSGTKPLDKNFLPFPNLGMCPEVCPLDPLQLLQPFAIDRFEEGGLTDQRRIKQSMFGYPTQLIDSRKQMKIHRVEKGKVIKRVKLLLRDQNSRIKPLGVSVMECY